MYKKFPIILAFLIIGGGVLWLSIKPSVSFFGSKVEEEKAEEFSIKLESKYRAKYQKGAEVYICQASRGAYAEPI